MYKCVLLSSFYWWGKQDMEIKGDIISFVSLLGKFISLLNSGRIRWRKVRMWGSSRANFYHSLEPVKSSSVTAFGGQGSVTSWRWQKEVRRSFVVIYIFHQSQLTVTDCHCRDRRQPLSHTEFIRSLYFQWGDRKKWRGILQSSLNWNGP